MKKLHTLLVLILTLLVTSGFSYATIDEKSFDLETLYDYQEEYETEEVGVCALGQTKTYEDYRSITDPTSPQYWFIRNKMEVDYKTGFLLDEDGFIGVALGSYFGNIGDRFYFSLDNGVTIPVVKIDEKADIHTDSLGCAHSIDGSVIEFVIDRNIANDYYGHYRNGYVLQGNFANYPLFNGSIVKIEKVLDEKRDDYVIYDLQDTKEHYDSIFNYASGY